MDKRPHSFELYKNEIHVYTEGKYYILYNESAYIFYTQIKRCRVNVMTNRDNVVIYFIKFSEKILQSISNKYVIKVVSKNHKTIKYDYYSFDNQLYKDWCKMVEITNIKNLESIIRQEVIEKRSIEKLAEAAIEATVTLEARIKHSPTMYGKKFDIILNLIKFNLEDASPTECMMFLYEMKKNALETTAEFQK